MKTLDNFTPRQKEVYRMRTQFLGDRPTIPSLQDVADKLGITRARVHQIEQDIMKKIMKKNVVPLLQKIMKKSL